MIGYDVERRTNQHGEWTKINAEMVEVRKALHLTTTTTTMTTTMTATMTTKTTTMTTTTTTTTTMTTTTTTITLKLVKSHI